MKYSLVSVLQHSVGSASICSNQRSSATSVAGHREFSRTSFSPESKLLALLKGLTEVSAELKSLKAAASTASLNGGTQIDADARRSTLIWEFVAAEARRHLCR